MKKTVNIFGGNDCVRTTATVGYELAHAFLSHRVFAALAAIRDRLRGVSAAALATPPFRPPRRPRATAWGFFFSSTGGSVLGAWPVASRMIWNALWLGSLGRGSRFLDRSGMDAFSVASM